MWRHTLAQVGNGNFSETGEKILVSYSKKIFLLTDLQNIPKHESQSTFWPEYCVK